MKKFFLHCVYTILLTVFMPYFAYALETAPYSAGISWVLGRENAVLCIELSPADGYYTYAPNQKDVYPTEIRIRPFAGAYPVIFPKGSWKEDSVIMQKVRIFEGTFRIYALFPEKQPYGQLELSLLACSGRHCLPFLLQRNLAEIPETDFETFQFKNELHTLLYAAEQKMLAAERTDTLKKTRGELLSAEKIGQPLPVNAENIADTAENEISAENGLDSFSLENLRKKAAEARQDGGTGGEEYAFSVRPFAPGLEVQGMAKALLFGVLAGFILNFMPCVLPVAALKLRSFLGGSGVDERSFREQMLYFACGIVAWFVVLALLLGIMGFTWGQLFQQYWLMLAVCLLVFVLGLSLFGVFHLPVLNLHAAEGKNKKMDSFLSGFLATVLATPCSGPLLGGVLGFALTQPFYAVVLIFLSMGLGMALPYVVFACNPRMARFMPKSGNWLLAMEKALAFFLMGTALYLFSLLPAFLHIKTLIFALCLSLCLFVWGSWACLQSGGKRLVAGTGLAAVCVCLFVALFVQPLYREEKNYWNMFSKQEFLADLGRTTQVLKFTADWCPTCKVLEKTVFTQKNMETLADDSVRFVLVDMTRFDEDTQNLLKALGSASIPLLAVFPQNAPYQPIIVRDIYTFNTLQQALRQAVSE